MTAATDTTGMIKVCLVVEADEFVGDPAAGSLFTLGDAEV